MGEQTKTFTIQTYDEGERTFRVPRDVVWVETTAPKAYRFYLRTDERPQMNLRSGWAIDLNEREPAASRYRLLRPGRTHMMTVREGRTLKSLIQVWSVERFNSPPEG